MRRILAFLLLISLFASLFAFSALAESADSEKISEPEDETGTLKPEGKGIRSFDEIDDPNGSYFLLEDIIVRETYTDTFFGKLNGNGRTIITGTTLFRTLNGATLENFLVTGELDNPSPTVLEKESEKVYYSAVAISVTGKTTFKNINSSVVLNTDKYTSLEKPMKLQYGTFAATAMGEFDILFENCTNSGQITSTDSAGGILGYCMTRGSITFKNCRNYGKITANGEYAGGIAGNIDSAYTFSAANNTASLQAGNSILFENCVNSGKIDAPSGSAGGIAGRVSEHRFHINSCQNNSPVFGKRSVGGILGHAVGFPVIKKCVNNGDIGTAGISSDCAGGIVGSMLCSMSEGLSNIVDCVNSGKVGTSVRSGGILGYAEKMRHTDTSVYIRRCTNKGDISPSDYAGGILGYADVVNEYAYAVVDRCINSATVWSYVFGSQLVCYADSCRNIITNNVMAGKSLDANSMNSFDSKLVFLACDDADAMMTSAYNNYSTDREIEFYLYSHNSKNRVPISDRPEGSLTFADPMMMASGEVAFRMNEFMEEELFRQTIGVDTVPTFSVRSKPVLRTENGIYVNDPDAPAPVITGIDTGGMNRNEGIFALNPAAKLLSIIGSILAVIIIIWIIIYVTVRIVKKIRSDE